MNDIVKQLKAKKMTAKDFGLKLGIKNTSYISQMFSGTSKMTVEVYNELRKLGILIGDKKATEQYELKPEKGKLPSRQQIYDEFKQSRIVKGAKDTGITYYKWTLEKNAPLLATTEKEVNAYLANFKTHGNRMSNLRALKTFYNWRKRNYNLDNPANDIPVSEKGETIPPRLTKEQIQILLKSVDDTKNAQITPMIRARNKAMIILFIESGLRRNELLDQKLENFDYEHRKIFVHGKNDKEAYAPFEPIAQKYLKDYLEKARGMLPKANETGIWIDKKGKPIGQNGLRGFLDTLKANTGLPATNPHTFRRTFACLLLDRGFSIKVIMMLGRWKTEDMVIRYTRGYTQDEAFKMLQEKNKEKGGLLDFLNNTSIVDITNAG
jgi:site-specific recombinase XerD